jgi:transglutaminase-like putative cysteine protease
MRFSRWVILAAAAATLGCASTDESAKSNMVADLPMGPTATFDVKHELTIKVPDGAKKVRVWFAMPREDESAQTLSEVRTTASTPLPWRQTHDSQGNRQLFFEIDDANPKEVTVTQSFQIERREVLGNPTPDKTRPYEPADLADKAQYLQADANVVIDDKIKTLAAEIVGTEKNPVVMARQIYDWVLGNVDYWVKDPKNKKASPVGSTSYCLETKTGNCTDFHSLWMSLARAAGIPTRLKYGSFFKKELDGQDADQSYHCWPEFWAPNLGWVPHDVAVADIFVGDFKSADDKEAKTVRLTTAAGYDGADPKMVDYYFGNIDNRRVTWSIGRDLTLEPKQSQGPVNALPKAYVEVDGQIAKEKEVWTRKLTFHQTK